LREGSNHTLYVSPDERKVTTIVRHREINEYLAEKICRDPGMPEP
jgi:hypothetical protein